MRPLEKTNLQTTINTIDTYINGKAIVLTNKIFVSKHKMFIPVEELLKHLDIEYKAEEDNLITVNSIYISETCIIDENDKMIDCMVKNIRNILYVEAAFFMSYLDITLAWEDETRTLYVCTFKHFDGYRLLPDEVFEQLADNSPFHGYFMYVDGIVSLYNGERITVETNCGSIILVSSKPYQFEKSKIYRFCFSFNSDKLNGQISGRLLEAFGLENDYVFGHMIYTKDSYDSFKDYCPIHYDNDSYSQYLGFNTESIINMFIQFPELINDRKRFIAVLSDLFPVNRRNINLFILAYDAGIISEIQNNELDDILVYKCANMLIDDYGINSEYAFEIICLWFTAYGSGVLNKTFIAKKKYSQKIQEELQAREISWVNSRLFHPKSIGSLIYFEPVEWPQKKAEDPYTGIYYYPYKKNEGMIWITRKDNIAYCGGDNFNYNGIISGFCRDNLDNLISTTDIRVAGLAGKKINANLMIDDEIWEYDNYIIPTEDSIYMFMFGEKYGISPAMLRYEMDFISKVQKKDSNTNDKIVISNAVEFEKRLNCSENLNGSIVTFEVIKVCDEVNPVLGGYNLWGGEHLNFISKVPANVKKGDCITVKVLFAVKTIGDSWAIYYELFGESDKYKNVDWADLNEEHLNEILNKIKNHG